MTFETTQTVMAKPFLAAALLATMITTKTSAFTASKIGNRLMSTLPSRREKAVTAPTMKGWSPLGALRSPAGKITLSPEVTTRGVSVVPAEDIEELSRIYRQFAKAAVVVVRDSAMLAGVVKEQQSVLGDFPGPCPVVYRPDPSPLDDGFTIVQTAVLHDASAVAVQLSVNADGSLADSDAKALEALVASAKSLGVTVIPELLGVPLNDEEAASTSVRSASLSAGGAKFVFLASNSEDIDRSGAATIALSSDVIKEVAVVGVVDVPPGQDLLKETVKGLEESGLAGVILAESCVPEQLGVVDSGRYFAAAVSNLRSTASENFRVRLKSFSTEGGGKPSEWMKYINTVEKEGLNMADQLKGDEGDNLITPGMKGEDMHAEGEKRKFDPEKGDWKGF